MEVGRPAGWSTRVVIGDGQEPGSSAGRLALREGLGIDNCEMGDTWPEVAWESGQRPEIDSYCPPNTAGVPFLVKYQSNKHTGARAIGICGHRTVGHPSTLAISYLTRF